MVPDVISTIDDEKGILKKGRRTDFQEIYKQIQTNKLSGNRLPGWGIVGASCGSVFCMVLDYIGSYGGGNPNCGFLYVLPLIILFPDH